MPEDRKRLQNMLAAEREAWTKRIRDDIAELEPKVQSMVALVNGQEYYKATEGEQGLIVSQLGHMQSYLKILKDRLAHRNQG